MEDYEIENEGFRRTKIEPWRCFVEGKDLISDQYWLMMGMSLVGMLIGGMAMYLLIGTMICGLFLNLFGKMRGELMTFDMLFKGFDFAVPSIIASLIYWGAFMVLYLITYVGMIALIFGVIGMGGGTSPGGSTAAIVVVLFGVLLMGIAWAFLNVSMFFLLPLIVERKLEFMPAFRLSFKAGMAHFWGIMGFGLLHTLFSIIGAFLCGIGSWFYLPIIFAAWAVAYRRVFMLMEDPAAMPALPPAPGGMPPPPANDISSYEA